MSNTLANEASWRAGWSPDDRSLYYDGKAVFYNRKDPKYLRWENERQRQPNRMAAALLVGPSFGDSPDPNVPNPFYRPARAARSVQVDDSDSDYVPKQTYKGYHVEENSELKEPLQLVFEYMQSDQDPYGKIAATSAIALVKYCGGIIQPEAEERFLKEHDGGSVDIYQTAEFYQSVKEPFDDPNELIKALQPFANADEITQAATANMLATFGDHTLNDIESELVAQYVTSTGEALNTVTGMFLGKGKEAYLNAAKRTDGSGEEMMDEDDYE